MVAEPPFDRVSLRNERNSVPFHDARKFAIFCHQVVQRITDLDQTI
jgi:hypothetical protein